MLVARRVVRLVARLARLAARLVARLAMRLAAKLAARHHRLGKNAENAEFCGGRNQNRYKWRGQ